MPRVKRTGLERVGALSEADYWTLSIGPDRTLDAIDLVRLEAVWRAHPDAEYMGRPHCWGWWRFDSGLGDGHIFTGTGYLGYLWLERRGWLTPDEADALARARARRDDFNARHSATAAAEYRRKNGYDFDDYRDPLAEARQRHTRRREQMQKESTT